MPDVEKNARAGKAPSGRSPPDHATVPQHLQLAPVRFFHPGNARRNDRESPQAGTHSETGAGSIRPENPRENRCRTGTGRVRFPASRSGCLTIANIPLRNRIPVSGRPARPVRFPDRPTDCVHKHPVPSVRFSGGPSPDVLTETRCPPAPLSRSRRERCFPDTAAKAGRPACAVHSGPRQKVHPPASPPPFPENRFRAVAVTDSGQGGGKNGSDRPVKPVARIHPAHEALS